MDGETPVPSGPMDGGYSFMLRTLVKIVITMSNNMKGKDGMKLEICSLFRPKKLVFFFTIKTC